jgi:Ni/Co efflux regulator RcnB
MESSMNKKAIVSAIMAIYLTTGGLTFAQGNGDRNDRGRNEQRGGQQDRREAPARANDNERRDERGVGRNHEFHRGDRLPAEYRHRQYVVDDWRGHNLSAPPRGYQWVQSGGDYVLIAIATGIIAQLLLNH